MNSSIHINDLSLKLATHRSAVDAAIARVIDSGYVVLGPEVANFESSFSKFLGVKYCVGVGNGTDALEIGLRAIGVKKNHLVATVANAGFYTATAILSIGAEPFFLDVNKNSCNTTLSEVARAIDSGVHAIVLTHLYGLAVQDTLEIYDLCKRKNIPLLEDCAQSHGAVIGGQKVGSFGRAATFSFYPTKNLGALGDGGAIVTNSKSIAESASSLRQYGWKEKYLVSIDGGRNSRLDEMQAAILSSFLPSLEKENSLRREIAKKYNQMIHNSDIALPISSFSNNYVAHLYVIKTQHRESLRRHLTSCNINSDIHYPTPDHQQIVFKNLYLETDKLSVTDTLAKEVLTLPCHPFMTDAMVEAVILAMNSWKP